MPHYNPVLHNFGDYIRLFYHVGSGPSSWITKFVDSFDGGKTWKDVTYLERSALIFTEYSYPTVIADGNTLHVTYTWNRFHIAHATIEF